MVSTRSDVTILAAALRDARQARRVSIAALAAQSGVSPRLISEFEQGKRPNVSLETALRLLQLMEVTVTPSGAPLPTDEDRGRSERAARRRRTWVGERSTLAAHDAPTPPAGAAARLAAVASASRLSMALQHAPAQKAK